MNRNAKRLVRVLPDWQSINWVTVVVCYYPLSFPSRIFAQDSCSSRSRPFSKAQRRFILHTECLCSLIRNRAPASGSVPLAPCMHALVRQRFKVHTLPRKPPEYPSKVREGNFGEFKANYKLHLEVGGPGLTGEVST